jgi:hypothetical protein
MGLKEEFDSSLAGIVPYFNGRLIWHRKLTRSEIILALRSGPTVEKTIDESTGLEEYPVYSMLLRILGRGSETLFRKLKSPEILTFWENDSDRLSVMLFERFDSSYGKIGENEAHELTMK